MTGNHIVTYVAYILVSFEERTYDNLMKGGCQGTKDCPT